MRVTSLAYTVGPASRKVRKPGLTFLLSGYSHENPIAMTLQQQRDVLDYTYKQLTDFCGKPPIG